MVVFTHRNKKLCLALIVAFLQTVSFADSQANISQLEPGSKPLHPVLVSDAEVPVGTEKMIEIYQGVDSTGKGRVGHYLHKPLLALKTRSKPLDGWPNFILNTDPLSNGDIELHISFIASDSGLIALAKQAIADSKSQTEYLRGHNYSINDVHVMPWDTEAVKVTLLDRNQKPISSNIHRVVNGERYKYPIKLIIDTSDVKRTKKQMLDGEISFEVALKWLASQQESGIAKAQASNQLYQGVITSFEQVMGDSSSTTLRQNLFRKERREILAKARTQLNKSISASSAKAAKEVAALMTTIDLQNLLPKIDSISLPSADPDFNEKVNEYLKPLEDSATSEKLDEDKTVDTKEKNITLDLKKEPGFKIEDKRKTERTYGVTLTNSETQNRYVASSIDIYRLRDSYSEWIRNQVVYLQYTVAYSKGWNSESPLISSNFTDQNESVASVLSGKVPKAGATVSAANT